MLYQKISKKDKEKKALNVDFLVSRMLVMAKVLFGLHLVSVLLSSFLCSWITGVIRISIHTPLLLHIHT